MSKIYTIKVLKQDYSKIHLNHDDGLIALQLNDIDPSTRHFYDGDLCTFDETKKRITVINSNMIDKLVVGIITIDKKVI